MKKVAIFQSDLHVGGIQKSLVNLISMLPSDEFGVDVFLYDTNIFYDTSSMKSNVHIFYLNPLPYWNRFIYFNVLRKSKPQPINDTDYDLAIDFSSYRNECALGALNTRSTKKVMWIHNDVSIKKQEEPKYRVLCHFFKQKWQYFDAFVAVSEGIIPSFINEASISSDQIQAIPNFINTREIFEKSQIPIEFEVDRNKYNLCSMGRLCHQKGFDILLDEFSEVIHTRQDMHLYIIGDGPNRESLQAQCNRLGLDSFVSFLGNQSNPFPYLRQMDGFVLDSRYEGQGMVLWEAKALGLTLYFPKHLEKYNAGLTGQESIISALIQAERHEKQTDDLVEYNTSILQAFRNLFL